MTALVDRPNTAVLVVDVQNDVVAGAFRRDEVIANIVDLVERARASGVPVVWVQHSSDELPEGSDGWQYVPELERDRAETVIHKRYGDAFEDTALEAELRRHGVGRVIVAGAQSDACIRSTLHGAFVRGYDTVLVGDAHTTEDLTEHGLPSPEAVVAHTNATWPWQRAPDRTAAVVAAADVAFVDEAGPALGRRSRRRPLGDVRAGPGRTDRLGGRRRVVRTGRRVCDRVTGSATRSAGLPFA